MTCPLCKRAIRESQKGFFCTGYKEGCNFKTLWKETRRTTFTKTDIKALLEGKKTQVKKCKNKEGRAYECRYILDKDNDFILKPIFENKR